LATLQEILGNKTQYADEVKITLADGVETTLGEVRKGYMMESDYRKKTSAVAEAKRSLDSERQQFEAARLDAEAKLEALAAKLIKRDPDTTQTDLERELQSNPVAKALSDQVKGLTEKISTLEKATGGLYEEVKQSRQSAMVDQHRRVLDGIKSKDPDLDEAELVTYAKSNYVPRLDLAYRLLTEEKRMKKAVEDAKNEAKQLGIEEGKRLAIAPTLPQRARFLAPEMDKDAPTSFDEAADRAVRDPEIIGLLSQQGS